MFDNRSLCSTFYEKEMIATIVEWFNDREGDFNKGADVFIRFIFFWFESYVLHFAFGKPAYICFILSTAIFFLVFDYWIAYTLIKNGTLEPPRGVKYHWFRYSAKKGFVDNISFWRNMNPWGRFAIRVGYFIIALVLYFKV
jgi:hypothetical protein